MNKEHVFPKWLLKRTNCLKDYLDSPYGKIPGDQLTVPLCEDCNTQLGQELEVPVSRVFEQIERGNGFNDHEAELLIRWMWKINGLFYWSICNDKWKYGYCTVKERVLQDIEMPRSRISIGVSLIDDVNENYGCAPIGMDAFPLWSNVYAAGVYSHVAIIVFLTHFSDYIDKNKWTVYSLSDSPLLMNPNKRIYPHVAFRTGSEAITYVKRTNGNKSYVLALHESVALIASERAMKLTTT